MTLADRHHLGGTSDRAAALLHADGEAPTHIARPTAASAFVDSVVGCEAPHFSYLPLNCINVECVPPSASLRLIGMENGFNN